MIGQSWRKLIDCEVSGCEAAIKATKRLFK